VHFNLNFFLTEYLQGSTGSSGGLSPFDINKHSERVKMFHKSPGLPPDFYTSKPVVTSTSEVTVALHVYYILYSI
jgi:hypothetical protein